MQRFRKIALWSLASVVGVCAVLLVGVFSALNTSYGRHFVEGKLPSLTNNMVQVDGLSTVLPWHLALQKASIKDVNGVWLTLEKADLRLNLLDIVHKTVHITHVRAARLVVTRKPVPSTAPTPPSDTKTSLPALGVKLDELRVDDITVGSEVVGQPFSLSLAGHAFIPNIASFTAPFRLDHLPTVHVGLDVKRRDQNASAHIDLNTEATRTDAVVRFSEERGGFVSTFGHMPALDPFLLQADIHGPTNHLQTSVSLQAGETASGLLKASLAGTSDLLAQTGTLALRVTAPRMTIRPDIGWESIDVATDLRGSLKAPAGTGHVTIEGLSVAGSGAQKIQADLQGNTPNGDEQQQRLTLAGIIDGLSIPGKDPTLFAASPVRIQAMFEPSEKKGRPFELALQHDLVALMLKGQVLPSLRGHLTLDTPHLEGFAGALGGTALQGKTHFETDFSLSETSHDALEAQLTGDMSIVGGQEQAAHLIGRNGHLALRVKRLADKTIQLERLALDGNAVHLGGKATLSSDQTLSSSLHINLPDLKQAHSILRGKTDLDAEVAGALTDLSATLHMSSMIGIQRPGTSIKEAPLALNARIDHLPSHPNGHIDLKGEFDRSPVRFDAAFQRSDNGNIAVSLKELSWKTLQGNGDIALPAGQKIPTGDLDINIHKLEAFRSLIGKPVRGHLTMGLHTQKEAQGNQSKEGEKEEALRLVVDGQASMADYAVRHIGITGDVKHLPDNPYTDVKITLDGLKAQRITGTLQAQIKGPKTALALTTKGAFEHLLDAPARFNLSAVENIPDKKLNVKTLVADVKGEHLQLLAPALIDYGEKTGVDHLQMRLSAGHGQPADIKLAGYVKPELKVEVAIEKVTPALAAPFAPSLRADGMIEAHASLHGTLAAPVGKITLDGKGLHMKTDPGASIPPASFHVQTDLQGKVAQLHSHMEAGHGVLINVKGTAPLQPDGKIDMAAQAKVDMSLANAILGASGMGATGQLSLDMAVRGTLKKPNLTGSLTMRDGTFDHYAQGVHLTGMTGDIIANGDTVHIQQFLIHAGEGTMTLTGDIGALRPGKPVDLQFVMDRAQPLRNDMIEETLNSQLHIFGQATSRIDVQGNVKIPGAEINIPNSMSASIPQLEVVSAEKDTKATEAPPLIIGLNVDVTSPGKIFIRGHGLFAEMQANLNVGGTSKAPAITGGVDLKRGNFNLAGISLNFTHGRVGFNGTGVNNKLDPTIDFRADRNANGTLASLLVTGHASAPKIDFASSPQLSRDEILSLLLFGQSRASLSATQLAELGAAIVQITGGSSFDPIGTVRNTLGLDHLGVGGGGSVENGGTSVEAGKYVMKGVYVGAKEGLSGKGAQAQVRVDLTKNLKLNTTVGTGGQVTGFTTPENDPGSSVGLSYGIDY